VVAALRWRGEGLRLRAMARMLGTHKNTITEWERRFGAMKPTLMLYGLCPAFIQTRSPSDSRSVPLFPSRLIWKGGLQWFEPSARPPVSTRIVEEF